MAVGIITNFGGDFTQEISPGVVTVNKRVTDVLPYIVGDDISEHDDSQQGQKDGDSRKTNIFSRGKPFARIVRRILARESQYHI